MSFYFLQDYQGRHFNHIFTRLAFCPSVDRNKQNKKDCCVNRVRGQSSPSSERSLSLKWGLTPSSLYFCGLFAALLNCVIYNLQISLKYQCRRAFSGGHPRKDCISDKTNADQTKTVLAGDLSPQDRSTIAHFPQLNRKRPPWQSPPETSFKRPDFQKLEKTRKPEKPSGNHAVTTQESLWAGFGDICLHLVRHGR